MTPARLLAGALAVAVAALAGCGGDDPGNPADRSFAATMVPHHEGAIEMARLARTRARRPEIRELAANILRSQSAEVEALRRHERELADAGVEQGHMGMSAAEMGMDGDMAMLRDARPFDRAFIDMMVPHHEGAIAMARHELERGEHRELRRMAIDIIRSQHGEVERMEAWRERWYGEPPPDHDAGGHGGMDMDG